MTTTLYFSWRDVPKSKWRWVNFSPAEIACRGTSAIKVNEEALDSLQALRGLIGKPMIVLSGYRSPEHNRRVGGAPGSKHMDGKAFDISMANHNPGRLRGRRAEGELPRVRLLPAHGFHAHRPRPCQKLG